MAKATDTRSAAHLYSVRDVKVLIESPDVQVREFILGPGEEVPWHYHTNIVDTCICLRGLVRVDTRAPIVSQELRPGENHPVPKETAHRVVNIFDGESSFLLVQGIGPYDFDKIPDAQST